MYYEIQYYCIGNIVCDRKLTFNNKEYMINLHIDWNIIYFNHLEKQSTQKTFLLMHCFINNLTSLNRAKVWCQWNAFRPPPPPPVAWAAVRSRAMVLLLLTFYLLLLPLWESVIVLCFVVGYFMSILVLQSS